MSLLAAIRPDDWNWALLVHVGGAMILVGGTLTAAAALALARGDELLLRLGYRALLLVALPGFVLMRVGAEWISAKLGLERIFDEDGAELQSWVDVGYVVADLGGLLFLLALVLGGIGVVRLRAGNGATLLRVTTAMSIALLAAYVVAVWAMTAKPG